MEITIKFWQLWAVIGSIIFVAMQIANIPGAIANWGEPATQTMKYLIFILTIDLLPAGIGFIGGWILSGIIVGPFLEYIGITVD